jgi:rubrerythrin
MSFSQCMSNCQCDRCRAANKVLNKGKVKRFLPQSVRIEIEEKRAQQESLDLFNGRMSMQCPKCSHYSKFKIGPIMSCPRCGHKIQ